MARPLRIHVAGGIYHVTLRGNHRQDIFRTPRDRELLDVAVADAIGELGARVHAYCWMSNHIHLLIQVSNEPLGRIILRVASRYARKYQQQLETTGHLFERRHHAVIVDADAYLLTLIRYIHLNPVRAGLAADPAAYPWSSHCEYLGRGRVSWVCTKLALSMLSADPQNAPARYLAWMNVADDALADELTPCKSNSDPRVLGDAEFRRRVAATGPCRRPNVGFQELLVECSRRFDLAPEALMSDSRARHLSAARAWLSREALARGVATTSAIARRLNRTEAAIRKLMLKHPMSSSIQ